MLNEKKEKLEDVANFIGSTSWRQAVVDRPSKPGTDLTACRSSSMLAVSSATMASCKHGAQQSARSIAYGSGIHPGSGVSTSRWNPTGLAVTVRRGAGAGAPTATRTIGRGRIANC